MHDHRTETWAMRAAPGSTAFDDQRHLLLELVVDPPEGGDVLADLARVLDRPASRLVEAAGVLERAGLAVREGDRVRASGPALAFERLWPVRL